MRQESSLDVANAACQSGHGETDTMLKRQAEGARLRLQSSSEEANLAVQQVANPQASRLAFGRCTSGARTLERNFRKGEQYKARRGRSPRWRGGEGATKYLTRRALAKRLDLEKPVPPTSSSTRSRAHGNGPTATGHRVEAPVSVAPTTQGQCCGEDSPPPA